MADQRIQCSEEMVGAGHPTKQDTLNRLMLVEHENDGTHKSGLKHAALTIDGTSPLSLSGQAISLKNDAAAAITEVDTGTLDNSTTKIPTNKTVYDAILTHQQVLARSLMG